MKTDDELKAEAERAGIMLVRGLEAEWRRWANYMFGPPVMPAEKLLDAQYTIRTREVGDG